MNVNKLLRVAKNPREAVDRLAQEAANLRLWLLPPQLDASIGFDTSGLPHPAILQLRMRGTPEAAEIARLAAVIRSRQLPLLGITINTGTETHWRRDYVSGRETPPDYFRLIPYLDFKRAGDHKVIWELNRHQHLLLLAQDVLLHDDAASLAMLERELRGWLEQNSYQCGINWASALEVAFRALSWMWIAHLVGGRMAAALRREFLESLYRHGHHLAHNLSFYFSPNTHLLGEAVALHALGVVFPDWPDAALWRELGHKTVAAQWDRQIRADGSHFEQSSYYHVYTLDMFLFHAHLAGCAREWAEPLGRMCRFLDALLGPERLLPLLGDDDGGRFFHPFGNHLTYGRATLATAACLVPGPDWNHAPEDRQFVANWWLDELPTALAGTVRQSSRRFENSGLLILADGGTQIVFDTGNLGSGAGGHSHSDALSLIIRSGGEEILVDAGTYTYVADPATRDAFRGSAGHNTARMGGQDQAEPAGPFAWRGRPETACTLWEPGPKADRAAGVCRYAGYEHTREIVFEKAEARLLVIDHFIGPPGENSVELFWHLAGTNQRDRLELPDTEAALEEQQGWRSLALGHREPAPVVMLTYRGPLPWSYRWQVRLSSH